MKNIRFMFLIVLLSFFVVSCDNQTSANTTTTTTTTSTSETDTITTQKYSIELSFDSSTNHFIENIEYEEIVSLPSLEKEGYTFLGWDYNGTIYNDTFIFEYNENIVLVAIFEINTYNVGFLDYDGTLLETVSVEHGSSAQVTLQPTRVGYTFIGWNKELSNITSTQLITAVYEISQYTVTFLDYDGTVLKTESVDYLQAATPPFEPVRTGYTFDTWDSAFDNVTEDITVNAIYTINQYTVTFETDGGNTIEPITVDYNTVIDLPVTEKVDNYFINWTFDEIDYTETILVDKDITLTASWKSTLADFSYSTHIDNYNITYIRIDSYNGTDPKVIIPDTYNDLPIRIIGEEAFKSNMHLEKVLIGFNVNIIEDFAFAFCENLIEVELNVDSPNEYNYLYEIGRFTFANCESLKFINLEVTFEFKTIKNYAFSMCYELTHVYINKEIEWIGSDAFDNCDKLTIYFEMFLYPYSNAFQTDWNADDCPIVDKVEYMFIDPEITYFVSIDGLIIANVKRYDVSDDIVIPNFIESFGNVTQIADYAFDGCGFESIVLPDTLIEIGKYAFNDCVELTEIIIPSSVEVIDENAFDNCINITIKCIATEKPVGWDINWNIDNYPVVWSYSE